MERRVWTGFHASQTITYTTSCRYALNPDCGAEIRKLRRFQKVAAKILALLLKRVLGSAVTARRLQ
jgi:hypothetical protein